MEENETNKQTNKQTKIKIQIYKKHTKKNKRAIHKLNKTEIQSIIRLYRTEAF